MSFESFASHDDAFDFGSDNESGFDNFASSDDGSGIGFGTGASDIALMDTVLKSKDAPHCSESNREQSLKDVKSSFTSFGLNDLRDAVQV